MHRVTLLVLALGASATTVAAQQPSYKREVPDSLARRAKVSEAAAVATAQRRIPSGKIQALELEREKGRIIYSFDVKVPGKSGTEEVNVDAATGKIIGVEHESTAAERKEAAADSARAKATKKP